MEALTNEERSALRNEILGVIVKRGGMARDPRLPAQCRDQYRTQINRFHRIYIKLGGHLSTQEILR